MSRKGKSGRSLAKLDQLHPLGGFVAEEEKALPEYFVEYEARVKPIRENLPGLFIHVGDKGSGKSAIQRLIAENQTTFEERLHELRPNDISLWTLAKTRDLTTIEDVDERWLNKTLWTYLFCVEIFKREYPQNFSSLWERIRAVFSSDLTLIRDLLERGYNKTDGRSFADRFTDLVEEVKAAWSGPAGEVSASAKIARRPAEHRTILTTLRELIRRSSELLSHNYLVLLDDLDLHWSASPAHRALLEGLLEAVSELSKMRTFSFVVALRRDIFASLTIDDRDKLRQGLVEVSWTEHQLKRILEARVGWAVRGNPRLGDLSDVFAENTWQPICQVATGNPRRLIEISERAITAARNGGRRRVTRQYADEAIARSSEEFLRDLAHLYRLTYPGLDEVARTFRGFRAEFSYSDLEALCAGFAGNIGDEAKRKWVLQLDDNPLALAHVLLEVQLLLYKRAQKAPAEEYSSTRHVLDENCWFAVHPAYRAALGVS